MFSQKSISTKFQKQSQANLDFTTAVLDVNASAPEADNYNKYIVVSDYISNNASLKPANNLTEIDQNRAETAAAADKTEESKISPETISAVITTYAQNTNILFVQNMIEFLKDNQLFLHNLSNNLLDMNKMSLELKTRIENSK